MKVIISGGGTAGHIHPGLALAETLKSTGEVDDFLFIGTKKGLEAKVIPKRNYNFKTIDVRGFERKFSLNFFKTFFYLTSSIIKCRRIINDFNPDVVVGLGGYVCVPVVVVAAFKKIPILLHEQNAVPGLANRLLARKADVVAISFASTKESFSKAKKVVLTGNPVRASILDSSKKEYEEFNLDPTRKTILIFGGSRGAQRINQAAIDSYDLFKDLDNLQIIHSTGKMNFDYVIEEIKKIQCSDDKLIYHCYPYLDKIDLAYSVADLIICRAGATTIAEITALGKASILVPYPFATDDHQKKNALALQETGAASLISDEQLNGNSLFQEATRILFNPSLLQKMSKISKGLSHPDAAQKMTQIVKDLVRSRE